jgi:DNA-binding CsgD family transcriptional regulator/GAF domain-containing protein
MSEARATPVTESFAEGGAALVGLACALTGASTLDELERAFRPRLGRLMESPMYGFYALDSDRPQIEHNVAVNVSDLFVARYMQVMEADPLLARSRETGHAVYNLGMMSEAEWAETEVYRHAYATHTMRHVVEVPITDGRQILGALHCATSEPDRSFTASDMQLAEAVADVLAIAIKKTRGREQSERALEHALAALELTGTAVVVSEPLAPELRLNAAARRLLAEVVNAEERLPPLLVRRPGGGRFSRRAEVELQSGETASLHASSQPVRDGALVTVLEIKRDHPRLDHAQLALLTPRESEVAMLVIEGLSDREISEALCLSPYTVHQYVKRIYRALDVDSRVALTRLLLGVPVGSRRT